MGHTWSSHSSTNILVLCREHCFSDMFRNNILPIISACSVGIGAYLGAKYERMNARPSTDSTYFPLFDVQAASVVPYDNKASVGSVGSSNTSQIMKYGFPSLENVRIFDDFVLSYDRRNRNAHWVFEHLSPDKLPSKRVANRDKSKFFEDDKIHKKFRSLLKDYKGSGFDRGHLAPAGNHRHSQQSMDQTFVMSNISPQVR